MCLTEQLQGSDATAQSDMVYEVNSSNMAMYLRNERLPTDVEDGGQCPQEFLFITGSQCSMSNEHTVFDKLGSAHRRLTRETAVLALTTMRHPGSKAKYES